MFDLEERENNVTIYCLETDFYFDILLNDSHHSDYYVRYSPASTKIMDHHTASWNAVVIYFDKWLDTLMREISEVDKWGRLFEEIGNLKISNEENEHRFSHEEYLTLERKFSDIKVSMIAIPFLPEQLEAINNKLDHLLTLTTELSKYDWQNLFIGVIVSVVIQLGVTQENAQLLYALIKQTFKGLFLQ